MSVRPHRLVPILPPPVLPHRCFRLARWRLPAARRPQGRGGSTIAARALSVPTGCSATIVGRGGVPPSSESSDCGGAFPSAGRVGVPPSESADSGGASPSAGSGGGLPPSGVAGMWSHVTRQGRLRIGTAALGWALRRLHHRECGGGREGG